MSSLFFPKLALTNLRKNKSTYLPYLLSGIFSEAAFYVMQSIAANPGLNDMPGAQPLQIILGMGTVVIGIFCVILMFYTNSFLFKRRKKELGLYSILGLQKRHIAATLFFETLYTAAITIGGGLLFGLLFSKAVFLLLLNLLNFPVALTFTIFPSVIESAAGLFLGIFLLILVVNTMRVSLVNPIELLHGGQTGEKEPKTNWPLTIIGILMLGLGYGIALTVKSPLDALLLFFVAVIAVIIGTYCLFVAGSVTLLKALKRNKKFYYQPEHFISVSGMLYRMKQNAVGLGNICILSTMVLVVVSTTVSLYLGQENTLKNRYPHDISVVVSDDDFESGEVDGIIDKIAAKNGVTLVDRKDYRSLMTFAMERKGYFDPSREAMEDNEMPVQFEMIPIEDYNRLTGENKTLSPGEVLFYADGWKLNDSVLRLEEREYGVKETLSSFPLKSGRYLASMKSCFVVMESPEAMKDLFNATSNEPLTEFQMHYFVCDTEGTEEAQMAFAQELEEGLLATEKTFSYDNRALNTQEWYGMYGGFLFLGIFLGVLFLMATALIIYYKQISEGYDDHDRFQIMQKVGMSRKEVKKTIHRQILTVFFLPIIVAVIHVAFAFGVICKLLSIFYLTDVGLFLLCTIGVIIAFFAIYAIVYALTARTYYRLVEE